MSRPTMIVPFSERRVETGYLLNYARTSSIGRFRSILTASPSPAWRNSSGISSYGLSQDLVISRAEAKEYIENYFKTYPGIKNYLDGLVAEAKETGSVSTLYGRKRPVPEISSSNNCCFLIFSSSSLISVTRYNPRIEPSSALFF